MVIDNLDDITAAELVLGDVARKSSISVKCKHMSAARLTILFKHLRVRFPK